jgi:hypothetical protein
MAQLRLIALALAACSASDAAPAPVPLATVPAGWVPLPAMALAARAAIAGSSTDAWGEPAKGCYAATLVFGERGTVAALLAEVKQAVSLRDVVEPSAAGGVLSFGFDKAPYKGRVRATLDGKTVTALACFWNDREPAACETACTAMLGSMQ